MSSDLGFIEGQNQERFQDLINDDVRKKPSIFHRILRERRIRIFVLFVIFALVVPILVYYFVIDQRDYGEPDTSYTCLIGSSYMVSCGKVNVTASECIKIQCCFDFGSSICYHSLPSRYGYNKSQNDDYFPSLSETPFRTQTIPKVKLSIIEVNPQKVKIILHTPDYIPPEKNMAIENKQYHAKLQKKVLGVEVYRTENEELLLTTMRGPTIVSEGYWEWNFQITDKELFGLGEIKLEENTTIRKVIYKSRDDHNTLPNFMGHSVKGLFHGVAVEHDGPLEVIVLPSRVVVLKSLAGKRITLNLVVGPKPSDVVKQLRPYEPSVPPYWTLGAHICRDGITTIEAAIEEYKDFVKDESAIQYSSDCIHEHLYAMSTEVTEQGQLETLIQALQEKSRFLMSLPPQILKNSGLYKAAENMNLLYKDKEGTILNGNYLKEEVGFPDFTHGLINNWIQELLKALPVSRLDGFVLRDNWPEEENYVFTNDNHTFPYLTKDFNSSFSRTIPWNAYSEQDPTIFHLQKHNKYGSDQINAFKALNEENLFLMTSSFNYGIQEAALIQTVNVSWTNLKAGLKTTLYHSMFGSSLISIPVCGSTKYFDEINEELCMRWYLVAATLPVFRISSEKPRRDPFNLKTGFYKRIIYSAIRKRYMLLPYYYSTLRQGDPLVRPMVYDFHSDNETFDLDDQYMLGNALLVVHPLLSHTSNLRVYLPPDVGKWYEFWGGMKYEGAGWINLFVVNSDWIMFFAEGNIIPMRNYKDTKIGVSGSQDSFTLAVALKCNPSTTTCHSSGTLHLQDSTLTFTANREELTISGIKGVKQDLGCTSSQSIWPHQIETVLLYGLEDTAVSPEINSVNLCNIEEDDTVITFSQSQTTLSN